MNKCFKCKNNDTVNLGSHRGMLCKDCSNEFDAKIELENEQYDDTIICPYCNHVQDDCESRYIDADEEQFECYKCEKNFLITGEISIKYNTKAIVTEEDIKNKLAEWKEEGVI
jgi:DNA-directed RNA polymerase subunit RPC12/RpoP